MFRVIGRNWRGRLEGDASQNVQTEKLALLKYTQIFYILVRYITMFKINHT